MPGDALQPDALFAGVVEVEKTTWCGSFPRRSLRASDAWDSSD